MSDALSILRSRSIHLQDANPFREWGDLVFRVSAFDHWLTEAEASDNRLMFYRQALEEGDFESYLQGEQRWESFYRDLGSAGARVVGERRNRTTDLPASSDHLYRLIRDSLRERRLMDVVFNRWPVRVLGGYDRTDTFLPATRRERAEIEKLALQHGLHVLS